jgi:hypothetical protein
MALPVTSGTYNYTSSAYNIIAGSLRICNAIAEDENPTSMMASTALDAMNAMVKGWMASGIHVWAEEECVLFFNPLQTQYTMGAGSTDKVCLFNSLNQSTLSATASAGATSMSVVSSSKMAVGDSFGVQLDAGTNYWTTVTAVSGTTITVAAGLPSQATSGAIVFDYGTPLMRPLRVMEGRRYQYASKLETPLILLSRFDYDYLPNKSNTGYVTQFYYDPQTGNGAYSLANGLMNVWPTPQDNTFGMRFVAQRPLQDFATLANIPDFPAEWIAALKWNLVLEIGLEYGIPQEIWERAEKQAERWFMACKDWDHEPEPILFGFATQPGYR